MASFVFDREMAGKRQFASITMELTPDESALAPKVAWSASAESVPREFHDAVEEGIRDALATGVLQHYPMQGISARVTDGSFDAGDSSEAAFRTAAVMAFREAAHNANPAMLEPIMMIEVITPMEHLGDVLSDLSSRRGRVREMAAQAASQLIRAEVPLAEMFGYATTVRSLTKGRATYTMTPMRFERMPAAAQDKLLNG